jgi:hypothetical protein
MKPPAYLFRLSAMVILIFVLALTFLRAKEQDITHDEAWTFVYHIDGGAPDILKFDTNNHILFNLLSAASVHFLGVGEFPLRVPSIFGTLLYLAAAYYFGELLFEGSILLPLTIALLTLNPTITDFFCAARGYGLGVAFLLLGMFFLARASERMSLFLDSPSVRRWSTVAALAFALSVASNLTNAVPVVALTVSWSVCVLLATKTLQQPMWRGLGFLARHFIAPGLLLGLALLWPFLIQMRLGQFDFGYDHLSAAVRDVFNSSFLYKWTDDAYNSLGGHSPLPHSWQAIASDVGVFLIAPALVLVILIGAIRAFRPMRIPAAGEKALLQILCGASVVSLILVAALHVLFHTPYPINRTCLYVVPLFTVTILVVFRDVVSCSGFSWLKPVGVALVLLIAVDYAASVHHSYFRYTAYDRRSRELFRAIQQDGQSRGLVDARIGGIYWYQPEIDFYRIMYKASWLHAYDLKDPSFPPSLQAQNSLQPAQYDYFLCTSQDTPDFDGRPVRTLFGDKVTGLNAVAIGR